MNPRGSQDHADGTLQIPQSTPDLGKQDSLCSSKLMSWKPSHCKIYCAGDGLYFTFFFFILLFGEYFCTGQGIV